MRVSIVPICLNVVALLAMLSLAMAAPAAAQQDAPAGGSKAKHAARISKPPAQASGGPGVYVGYCGQWFGCYTGIPLRCGENTRPYQDIANHTCFCVHDGCPQQ